MPNTNDESMRHELSCVRLYVLEKKKKRRKEEKKKKRKERIKRKGQRCSMEERGYGEVRRARFAGFTVILTRDYYLSLADLFADRWRTEQMRITDYATRIDRRPKDIIFRRSSSEPSASTVSTVPSSLLHLRQGMRGSR